MKCPYRRIQIATTGDDGESRLEDHFAECYGRDCPYYGKTKTAASAESFWQMSEVESTEYCAQVEHELWGR